MYTPVFVHYAKWKRKACSDFLKFFLANVSILIMVIIFENWLREITRNKSSITLDFFLKKAMVYINIKIVHSIIFSNDFNFKVKYLVRLNLIVCPNHCMNEWEWSTFIQVPCSVWEKQPNIPSLRSNVIIHNAKQKTKPDIVVVVVV